MPFCLSLCLDLLEMMDCNLDCQPSQASSPCAVYVSMFYHSDEKETRNSGSEALIPGDLGRGTLRQQQR